MVLISGRNSTNSRIQDVIKRYFPGRPLIPLEDNVIARESMKHSNWKKPIFRRHKQTANSPRKSEPILGIHFNSKLCHLAILGDPTDSVNSTSNPQISIPAFVWITREGVFKYGAEAEAKSDTEPEHCFYDLHQMPGQVFSENQIQKLRHIWPFELKNQNSFIRLVVHGQLRSPEDIFGGLVQYLKQKAEEKVQTKISRVCLAIPKQFGPKQVQALRKCLRDSEFTDIKFTTEPVAAYQNFDMAVCSIMNETIDVPLADGRPIGEQVEIVEAMINECCKRFKAQHNADLRCNESENRRSRLRLRLRKACENARDLYCSSNLNVRINLLGIQNGLDLNFVITPYQFQNMVNDLLRDCLNFCRKMILDKLGMNAIKCIVLAGESSNFPGVLEYIQANYPSARVVQEAGNAALVIASGAARFAHLNVLDNFIFPRRIMLKIPGEEPDAKEPILGIDFGTCFCCVALLHQGNTEVLQNYFGADTTPSYIQIPKNKEDNIIVGNVARDTASTDPENTIYDVKRMIGRDFNDVRISEFKTYWPFKISDKGGRIEIRTARRSYFPEELAEKIIAQLKTEAEDRFGEDITKAVLAVPVHFSPEQTQLLRQACLDSGFKSIEVVNEPLAAAIAYSDTNFCPRNLEGKGHALIFDLGGGTFDLCICRFGKNFIEVKTVDGHPFLGGDNFDDKMVAYCSEEFVKKHRVDLTDDGNYSRRQVMLRKECEQVKRYLSQASTQQVNVCAFYKGHDLIVPITRTLLNNLIRVDLNKCLAIVERSVTRAGIRKDITEIILVGGSSRIPLVRELLGENFPDARILHDVDPDYAVALGAAKAFSVGAMLT